jgi:dolichol-phosphate mannosyltransferase
LRIRRAGERDGPRRLRLRGEILSLNGSVLNTCILLPTYNERDNIGEIISRLFALFPDFRVLVVDDNSPDGTAEAVRSLQKDFPRLDLLFRPRERGFGSAYVAGFRRLIETGSSGAILMMDADLSHDPAHIPAMLREIGTCDVVIGSRYTGGGGVAGWAVWRRALSRAGNAYIRAITRMPFRDCTSGFILIRSDLLLRLDLSGVSSSGYAFLMELKYALWRSGARIREIPIVFRNRAGGESKLSGHIVREGIKAPWKVRLKERRPEVQR